METSPRIDPMEEESVWSPDYSTTQKAVLAIIPMFSGTLSVGGSSTILYIIWNDRKRKLSRVYHRLLLGMSIMDVAYSTMIGLSVLMVPKGEPSTWGAQGNMATCRVQGLFTEMGYAVYLYNMCLALYYLLVIRYGMRETTIVKYHLEKVMHFVCIGYPASFAVLGLVKDLYWPTKLLAGWCTIGSGVYSDSEEDKRKEYYRVVLWGSLVPFGLVLLVVTICMILIYASVRHQERTMSSRYGTGQMRGLQEETLRRTRETSEQAGLYVVAMFLCSVFLFGVFVRDMTTTFYFVFAALVKIFAPLQGLWNLLIYIRPRVNALHGRLRGESIFTVIGAVLAGDQRQNVRINLERRRSSTATSLTTRYPSENGNKEASCESSPPELAIAQNHHRNEDHFAPELGIRIIHDYSRDSLPRLDEADCEECEGTIADARVNDSVKTEESKMAGRG